MDGRGEDLESVRAALLEWYDRDHRQFPWRETEDPYAILVSEVMSQQTQLDRIVEPWQAFLERWPDVSALAAADRADVVAFWSDHRLGYNTRARYLHEAAEQVLADFDGELPRQPGALQSLMGVGPYTANAVASFAFDTGEAVVDTNVERVLYRAFDVPDDDEAFEATAAALMPDGESRDWNNAIMELGGVACRQSPACDESDCPWRQWCTAYRTGDFEAPDVPTQSAFEGSRRQMRGRVIDVLASHGPLDLETLGPRVRVDYDHHANEHKEDHPAKERKEGDDPADDSHDRVHADDGSGDDTDSPENGPEWLRSLLRDLERDGLVELRAVEDGWRAQLAR